MKDIESPTPEMQQLLQENASDTFDASYVETLKVQRDRWEKECVEAQATARRLQRANKILQLRIEQLEAELTASFEAWQPAADIIEPEQQRNH